MKLKSLAVALLALLSSMAVPAQQRPANEPAAAATSTVTATTDQRSISHAQLQQMLATRANSVTILDLRRNDDFDKDSVSMPGALRFEPEQFANWGNSIPKDKEVVLYCAHGKSISNKAVDQLRSIGVRARFVDGGFDAWKAAGGAVQEKPRQ
jgi:rhodanese-related sulfurtransferase